MSPKLFKSVCLTTVLVAAPANAFADRNHGGYDRGDRYRTDDRRDYDHRDDNRSRGSVNISIGSHTGGPVVPVCPPPPVIAEERIWVEPVYRTVADRRWIEPVYRTVTDRVWVAGETRTIPDRQWVPARYEWRDVVRYDRRGCRTTTREYVCVEPAHFVDCPRTVEVTPGYWKTCERQELVCAGRWETCERQELIAAGYWTARPVTIVVPPPLPRYEESHARIDLRFPIGR